MPDTQFKKLTPVLLVDAIEPCLPLWVERLGWTKQTEVPHGDRLGFVILVNDGIEVMYQTWDSAAADTGPAMRKASGASTALFIEVSDLDAIAEKLKGYPIALPRRRTFYGMDEIGVTEAGGHLVIFAQPVP
jgi:hypothetical protein